MRRFKDVFYAVLLGWKTRRIMAYLNTLPSIRESLDYIKLRWDLKETQVNDPFSKQIILKYPEMIKIFQNKYYDLDENAVWIKKPKTATPTKSTNRQPIKKERSKMSKIPEKQPKKKVETNRRRTFTYTRNQNVENPKKEHPVQSIKNGTTIIKEITEVIEKGILQICHYLDNPKIPPARTIVSRQSYNTNLKASLTK